VHQMDTPMALYDTPADVFVAEFIGSPGMNMLDMTVDQDGSRLIGGGGVELALPGELRATLAPFRGARIRFGIRPEHIHTTAEACSAPSVLRLQLELSELLGHETYLHLRAGDTHITGRASSPPRQEPGSYLDMHVDMARAHLFDPASGKRITKN